VGIFIVAVVGSAIISFQMPKIYEISSTLQLGNVNGLLISKEEAKEIILNQNVLLSIIKELDLNGEPAGLKQSIKIEDMKETSLLRIKMTSSDIEKSFKINDAIIKPLIVQGQKLYQKRVSMLNERLGELEAEIKGVEGDIVRTQAMISGLPASSNVSQSDVSLRIILLQNTLPSYETNLTALRNQRSDLRLSLESAKEFKVFESPIAPKNSIGPKSERNVVLAGILSLIAGVFLAFTMEFWQKNVKGKL
jgi:capsular polysaccharide biosynthesis protein